MATGCTKRRAMTAGSASRRVQSKLSASVTKRLAAGHASDCEHARLLEVGRVVALALCHVGAAEGALAREGRGESEPARIAHRPAPSATY
eukprot:4230086-Pleurochrysis_carterae.AAC.2